MKKSYAWNSETNNWQLTTETFFLYDGWNLIAETINSATNNSATNLFVWGLDLSGSLQGAGGIGGLLSATLGGTSSISSIFYAFDANGNVSDLIDAQSGAIVVHYNYSPFGECIVKTGAMADANTFRFSTKYWDNETDLGYWGYRYYHPDEGRWISRDPIGEFASKNLYAVVKNAATQNQDLLGLSCLNRCINDPPVSVFTFTMPPGIINTYYEWVSMWSVLSLDDQCSCKCGLEKVDQIASFSCIKYKVHQKCEYSAPSCQNNCITINNDIYYWTGNVSFSDHRSGQYSQTSPEYRMSMPGETQLSCDIWCSQTCHSTNAGQPPPPPNITPIMADALCTAAGG